MSAPISGEVEDLIAKLQGLDIEQADPALQDKLSQLVTATQSNLQKTSPHLLSNKYWLPAILNYQGNRGGPCGMPEMPWDSCGEWMPVLPITFGGDQEYAQIRLE
ncbi:hypothetical protein B0H14DRAFT_2630230 [Mycena olivaceomarginata]|nr:hypothetical protein B0H14DRAFT_2630230 [Mycena olivaceomarginata]